MDTYWRHVLGILARMWRGYLALLFVDSSRFDLLALVRLTTRETHVQATPSLATLDKVANRLTTSLKKAILSIVARLSKAQTT